MVLSWSTMPLRDPRAGLARLFAAAALLTCGAAPAAAQPGGPPAFHLGQHREEVARAVETPLDGGRCAFARADGTDYRLHFTPAGRLHRVETRRDLGPAAFTDAVRADFLRAMAAEHGPPDVAESHSGYVRAIWGEPGEARRVVKLTPADPGARASPLIMRENLLDPELLRQDRRAPLTTGPTPTVGEQRLSGSAGPRTACWGKLVPSRAAAAAR